MMMMNEDEENLGRNECVGAARTPSRKRYERRERREREEKRKTSRSAVGYVREKRKTREKDTTRAEEMREGRREDR